MLDVNNCFTHDGAGTLSEDMTAATQLTNVIDLIGASSPTTIRLGEGKKKAILKILVTTAFAGAASGVSFQINTDDTTNVSAGRTVYDTGTMNITQLAAGTLLQVPLVGVFERYLGVDFTVISEDATAGTIIAWLDEEVEPNVTVPDLDDTV